MKRGDLVVNTKMDRSAGSPAPQIGLILGDGPYGVLPPLVRVYRDGFILHWSVNELERLNEGS